MERWRCLSLTAIGLTLYMFLWGCTSPVEGLWPPSPGSPSHLIYVSLDTRHAMIALPVSPSLTIPLQQGGGEDGGRFEEWGYAERAWSLEDQRGATDVVRALFWPTEGVVEVGQHDKVWANRTPQPPSELFTFVVSGEGYRRLRDHLHATIVVSEPVATIGSARFYRATRSYHLFHTCHQYVALALREAGLPISPYWAFSRWSLVLQLRRATRMAPD